MTSKLAIEILAGNVAPRYDTDITQLTAQKAVITQHGMESGMPILDLQFTDADGNQYFTMISGNIVTMLCGAMAGVIQRNIDEAENDNATH